MPCIVLIGGIPGSGKSELIKYISQNINELYCSVSEENGDSESPLISELSTEKKMTPIVKKIIFDEICSVEDQAEIVKRMNGWRQFRIQLLEAAERYICEVCDTECHFQGPLSLRSQEILEKLKMCNNDNNAKLSSDVIFLIEDNFYYASMRYEWFQVARRDMLGFCQITVSCPLEIACQRNKERQQVIPEHKIKLMHSCMEYPDIQKNRWEKFSLRFDSSSPLNQDILLPVIRLIKMAMSQPAEMVVNELKLEAQLVCSKSVLHQADRILRKLTGEFIQEFKEKNGSSLDEAFIKNIIEMRQTLYKELRQGTLQLPSDVTDGIKSSGINFSRNYDNLEQILRQHYKQMCDFPNR